MSLFNVRTFGTSVLEDTRRWSVAWSRYSFCSAVDNAFNYRNIRFRNNIFCRTSWMAKRVIVLLVGLLPPFNICTSETKLSFQRSEDSSSTDVVEDWRFKVVELEVPRAVRWYHTLRTRMIDKILSIGRIILWPIFYEGWRWRFQKLEVPWFIPRPTFRRLQISSKSLVNSC